MKPRDEHTEQVMLFKMIDLYAKKYPILENIFAIPNGGHRNKIVAKKLKDEGVRRGYPDIGVDVARHGQNGLRIEMKRSDGGNGLSSDQRAWFVRLEREGYLCKQCNGWESAWDAICWYLGINPLRNVLPRP